MQLTRLVRILFKIALIKSYFAFTFLVANYNVLTVTRPTQNPISAWIKFAFLVTEASYK